MSSTLASQDEVKTLLKAASYQDAKEMSRRYHDFITEYDGGAVDLYHCDETAPTGKLDESIQCYCFQGMAKRFVIPRLGSQTEKATPNKHRPAVILTGVIPNLYPAGIFGDMLEGRLDLLENFGYHDIRLMAAISPSGSDPLVYWFQQFDKDGLDRIVEDMKGSRVLRGHPDSANIFLYSNPNGDIINFL